MVNQQLVDYIKNTESQGYTEEQLRSYLTQQGYNIADVEDALKMAKQVQPAEKEKPKEPAAEPGPKPPLPIKKIAIFGAMGLLVVVSIFMFISVFREDNGVMQATSSPEISQPTPVEPKPQPSGKLITYNNEEHGFRVRYPDSWEVRENAFGAIVLFTSPMEYDKDPFRENVNIAKENVPADITSEFYRKLKEEELAKKMENFNLISTDIIEVDGIKMEQLVHVGTLAGTRLKTMQVFFIRDGATHIISYSATEEAYDKYLPEANKIIYSFEFT